MSEEDALAEVRKAFRQEVGEYLDEMSAQLISLESGPMNETDLLGNIFRRAHSIKGAASSLGMREVERLAHGVEDVLDGLRAGKLKLNPQMTDSLLASFEALGRLNRGEPGQTASVEQALRGAATVEVTDAPSEDAVPRPAAMPSPGFGVEAERPPAEGLRIDAVRLDELLSETAEMVLLRARTRARHAEARALLELAEKQSAWLRQRHRQGAVERGVDEHVGAARKLAQGLQALTRKLHADAFALDLAAEALGQTMRELRTVPVSSVVPLLARAVREAGRRCGKSVQLWTEGESLKVDKQLLDAVLDPLLHLVRNAVDHGLELAPERVAAGKSKVGQVSLQVFHGGGRVHLVVGDDGQGINLAAVRATAVQQGLLSQADASGLSDGEAQALLFRPGFTTRAAVTELSGRGVGLDVVASAVKRLHGELEVSAAPGGGTRFELSLPLTLATVRVLLVRAGRHLVALPTSTVERLLRVDTADLGELQGKRVYKAPWGSTPCVALGELLGERPTPEATRVPGVVLEVEGGRWVVTVDEVVAEEELVVRKLPAPLDGNESLSGAGVRGDGSVVLLLEPSGLLQAGRRAGTPSLAPPGKITLSETGESVVLVADDSITSRMLQSAVIEGGGFGVVLAEDGRDALDKLLAEPGRFCALVSDVEMPRMTGVELCRAVRAHPQLVNLPVILLTSLQNPEHRQAGIDVGASAYLTKQSYDHHVLLDILRKLS